MFVRTLRNVKSGKKYTHSFSARGPFLGADSSFDRLTNRRNVLNLKQMMSAINDQRVNAATANTVGRDPDKRQE